MSGQKLKAAKEEAVNLKKQLLESQKSKVDTNLKTASKDVQALAGSCPIKARRTLKGHLNKIYDVHWASGSTHLVSASQDGRLIVWDGLTTNKLNAIPLRSCWVMSCGFAPSGAFVASGGLDNNVAVYNLADKETKDQPVRPCHDLQGHGGYISGIRFLDDNRLLSSSGDRSCALWDLQKETKTTEFLEHTADIVSLALSPNQETFITGSCDYTSKLWDIRTGKSQMTFTSHSGDVNAVDFFPDGNSMASASEDCSIRIFDFRSYNELACFTHKDFEVPLTSISFSSSGRLLFAGYDDNTVTIWDTLQGELRWKLNGHKGRVDCMSMSSDGSALVTGSWDLTLKVWA